MTFEVHSLRPSYNHEEHKLYVDYLSKELRRPSQPKKRRGETAPPISRPRNLALTGNYGAGKSSILSKIVEEFRDRVVSVSLSTLGSEEVNRGITDTKKDPLETPAITNSIQKEIVKQLLYREKPWRVPGSRFKRIERFRHWRGIGIAAMVAVAVTSILLVSGAMTRVETYFEGAFRPVAASYVGLALLLWAATYVVLLLLHNRLRIDKVTSGPATVSLTDKTESFFDKYLDELVYFFQTNKYDIVIFEDLDRFNDPYIFETLRELNTLLNSSKQIQPHTITFIYAIKDSIFEQLGKLTIAGIELTEDEIRRLAVTNRTKFFDLVIPVVPFISQRNSRDLLSKEMRSSGFDIKKPLIDLTSRYLVDMRLIKNVHNEFGIFRQKILRRGGVKGLDDQKLFAMVVYKNLNMADFEKVKEGTSALDAVHANYRALINQQIADADENIRRTQLRLRNINSLETRGRQLGDRLEEYLGRLLNQAGVALDAATFTLETSHSLADFREATFWSHWFSNSNLTLEANFSRVVYLPYYGQQTAPMPLRISLADLQWVFQDSLDPAEWEAADAIALRAELAEYLSLRSFLKHATMRDVLGRAELKLSVGNGTHSLVEMAETHLGTGLALDLLRAGHIDKNYSLYVSLYYDETVTAVARNFLLHVVEADAMDEHAEIGSGTEIEAMLDEAGDALFVERSIFNVQIFDHLLEGGDTRLEPSLIRLGLGGADEDRFLSAYLSNGHQLNEFVAGLTPHCLGLPLRIFEDASIDEEQRVQLLDTTLASLTADGNYAATGELGKFITQNYLSLQSIVRESTVTSNAALADLLLACRVSFPLLSQLSSDLRPLAVARCLYDFSHVNLTDALNGEANLSLDNIRSRDDDVYRYVIAHLAEYLKIVDGAEGTSHTIDVHSNLIPVLNDLASCEGSVVEGVIARATNATVVRLSSLKATIWPLIAAAGRLKASHENISSYIESVGQIDHALTTSLALASRIAGLEEVDQPTRRGLAISLINCTYLTYGKRVQLVRSVSLSQPLAVSELNPEGIDDELAGTLLSNKLLEESAANFTALAPAGWPAQRGFMNASEDFVGLLPAIPFTTSTMRLLAQDPLTPDAVKQTVVMHLEQFEGCLSPEALSALGRFALDHRLSVSTENIMRLARNRVAATTLVGLIDVRGKSLEIDEIVAVLALMPDNYRKLTTYNGHTVLPNSPEDIRLADRLIAADRVSTRDKSPVGGALRVNLRRRKQAG